MVGTHWLCVTRWRSISASAASASKCSITMHGAAEPLRRHAEAQRRGVVERRRREVDARLDRRRSRPFISATSVEGVPIGLPADGLLDALRPAGGARGVEQVARLRSRRRSASAGCARDRGLAAREARRSCRPPGTGRRDRRAAARSAAATSRVAARGDQHLRAAVAHDVLDLGRGEAVADRRVVEAGALRRPADLEEARVVLEQDRDRVAAASGPSERNSCAPWFERSSSWR